MYKPIALLAVLILALSSLLILPISATYPTPSVPEFSLKFVDASYDVPTTHSIDPYTGKDVTNQGYHVSIVNLVMFIENQPLAFDPQYSGGFLYNIQVKGHYVENWTQLFLNDDIPIASYNSSETSVIVGTLQSDGLALRGRSTVIPNGGQEDFRVEAMIGGYFKAGFGHTEFSGSTSDWSSIQTITVGDGSPIALLSPTAIPPTNTASSNPTITLDPTVTPSQSNSDGSARFDLNSLEIAIVFLLVIIAVLLVFVVFYLRRRNVG